MEFVTWGFFCQHCDCLYLGCSEKIPKYSGEEGEGVLMRKGGVQMLTLDIYACKYHQGPAQCSYALSGSGYPLSWNTSE